MGRSSGQRKQAKEHHPFERMLIEIGIKHRYTKPYRPQTNGKVERFWRTLQEDLIEETDFDSLEEFKDELMQYLVYYNHQRPHQGIDGKTPIEMMMLQQNDNSELYPQTAKRKSFYIEVKPFSG